MSIHVNRIVSLIKCIEKGNQKSCHFTSFLLHKKLCLNTKLHVFYASTYQSTLKSGSGKTKADNKFKSLKSNASIRAYVERINPTFAIHCPLIYMKTRRLANDTMYLFEKKTATAFVNIIIDDLLKHMTYIAEANPGMGVLTEELLKAGVTKIYAHESHECFYPLLYDLQEKYPDRIAVKSYNLFKMSKLYYRDGLDNKNRVKTIFMNVKPMSWEDKTCIQVIGATDNFVFLKHLILCAVFRTCFMSQGRACFYLAIPPSIWNVLSIPSKRGSLRCKYILYQTLFDCKCLGTIDRFSFLPWAKEIASKRLMHKLKDRSTMCVVKIEPKADLFTNYFKPADLIPYWYFVRYHMNSARKRIIPELEKWIPGCGVRLIEKNYTIFSTFGDLSPDEMIDLYKEFVSWPEYDTCLFLSSAEVFVKYLTVQSTK